MIRHLIFTPKFDGIIASFGDGRVFVFKIVGESSSLVLSNEPSKATCIDASRLTECFITGSTNAEVLVWVYRCIFYAVNRNLK